MPGDQAAARAAAQDAAREKSARDDKYEAEAWLRYEYSPEYFQDKLDAVRERYDTRLTRVELGWGCGTQDKKEDARKRERAKYDSAVRKIKAEQQEHRADVLPPGVSAETIEKTAEEATV